jgi:hypothetical protein
LSIYNNIIYISEYSELKIEKIDDYDMNITISIHVKTHGFAGHSEFCIQKKEIEDYIIKLRVLDNELKGLVTILDNDSDSSISFEFEGKKLKIYGQLGGSYNNNFIKFDFSADQTIIKLLLGVL